MELTEKDLLDKTHYGLKIYTFILQVYYPDENVISLSWRICIPTKNPFKNDSLTLILEEIDNQFLFKDSKDESFKGNPFDFAALHFKTKDQKLLQLLNKEMHLHIGENPWQKEDGFKIEIVKEEREPKIMLPKFSYFNAPVKNTVPVKKVSILDVYPELAIWM